MTANMIDPNRFAIRAAVVDMAPLPEPEMMTTMSPSPMAGGDCIPHDIYVNAHVYEAHREGLPYEAAPPRAQDEGFPSLHLHIEECVQQCLYLTRIDGVDRPRYPSQDLLGRLPPAQEAPPDQDRWR